MFTEQLGNDGKSVRLRDEIAKICKNDVMVIDIAKLDEESQGFVFGDVMRAVYNLKLGSTGRYANCLTLLSEAAHWVLSCLVPNSLSATYISELRATVLRKRLAGQMR